MGAKAVTGAGAVADHLALADPLAAGAREGLLVPVTGREPAAVIDAGVVAVAAGRRRDRDRARGRRPDRRAGRDGDVDFPCMLPQRSRTPIPRSIDRPDDAAGAALIARGERVRRQLRRDLRLKIGDGTIQLLSFALILARASRACRAPAPASMLRLDRGRVRTSSCLWAAIASRAAVIRSLTVRSRSTTALLSLRSSRTRPISNWS
jgi:hypothetical protein